MLKSLGFSLIRLNKAVSEHQYSVSVFDNYGRIFNSFETINWVDNNWSKKLRMEGIFQHAMLQSGEVYLLTNEEFAEKLAEWNTKAAA